MTGFSGLVMMPRLTWPWLLASVSTLPLTSLVIARSVRWLFVPLRTWVLGWWPGLAMTCTPSSRSLASALIWIQCLPEVSKLSLATAHRHIKAIRIARCQISDCWSHLSCPCGPGLVVWRLLRLRIWPPCRRASLARWLMDSRLRLRMSFWRSTLNGKLCRPSP